MARDHRATTPTIVPGDKLDSSSVFEGRPTSQVSTDQVATTWSRATGAGTPPSRASGVRTPRRAMGTTLQTPVGLDGRLIFKPQGLMEFASFQTCLGPVTPCFFPISSSWNGNVCPMPVPLYFGST